MDKKALLMRKIELEQELEKIEDKLRLIKNIEKPYVSNVSAYSGSYSKAFKTEKQARKKLQEYASKEYFKNGLNYGVYLYKWKEDGTKELLEVIALGKKDFKANIS